MVFTDGNANAIDISFDANVNAIANANAVRKASKAWSDHNVAVFAVGIGNEISEYGKLFALGASMYSMYSASHPQKERPIQIRRTEGVVSQISSLTFSEIVVKNLRKPFKNFQI